MPVDYAEEHLGEEDRVQGHRQQQVKSCELWSGRIHLKHDLEVSVVNLDYLVDRAIERLELFDTWTENDVGAKGIRQGEDK